MISITLEYPNVETAIVALGKLISAAPASQGSRQQADQPTPGAAEPSKRKGRADKGKARGSYKEHAEAITKAPEPAAPMTATEVQARLKESGERVSKAAEAVVAPLVEKTAALITTAATVASLEDAQAALEKLFAGKGAQAAISTLAAFGVSRLRDMKPEDYAAFIGKAEKAVSQ